MADLLRKPWLEREMTRMLKETPAREIPFIAKGHLQARIFHNYRYEKNSPLYNPEELITADVSDKFCSIRCTFSRDAEDKLLKDKKWRLTELRGSILTKVQGALKIMQDATNSSLYVLLSIHSFRPSGDAGGAVFGEPTWFNHLPNVRAILNDHRILRLMQTSEQQDDDVRSQASQESSVSESSMTQVYTQAKARKPGQTPTKVAVQPSQTQTFDLGRHGFNSGSNPVAHDATQMKSNANGKRKRLHSGWGDFRGLSYYDCQIPALQQKLLEDEACWRPIGEYTLEPIRYSARKRERLSTRSGPLQAKLTDMSNKDSRARGFVADNLHLTNSVELQKQGESDVEDEDHGSQVSWGASPEPTARPKAVVFTRAQIEAMRRQQVSHTPPPDSTAASHDSEPDDIVEPRADPNHLDIQKESLQKEFAGALSSKQAAAIETADDASCPVVSRSLQPEDENSSSSVKAMTTVESRTIGVLGRAAYVLPDKNTPVADESNHVLIQSASLQDLPVETPNHVELTRAEDSLAERKDEVPTVHVQSIEFDQSLPLFMPSSREASETPEARLKSTPRTSPHTLSIDLPSQSVGVEARSMSNADIASKVAEERVLSVPATPQGLADTEDIDLTGVMLPSLEVKNIISTQSDKHNADSNGASPVRGPSVVLDVVPDTQQAASTSLDTMVVDKDASRPKLSPPSDVRVSRRLPWQSQERTIQPHAQRERSRSQRTTFTNPYEIAKRSKRLSQVSQHSAPRPWQTKSPYSFADRSSPASIAKLSQGALSHSRAPYNFSSARSSLSPVVVRGRGPQRGMTTSLQRPNVRLSQEMIRSKVPSYTTVESDGENSSEEPEYADLPIVSQPLTARAIGPQNQSTPLEVKSSDGQAKSEKTTPTAIQNGLGSSKTVSKPQEHRRRTSKVLKLNLDRLQTQDGMDVQAQLHNHRANFLMLRRPPSSDLRRTSVVQNAKTLLPTSPLKRKADVLDSSADEDEQFVLDDESDSDSATSVPWYADPETPLRIVLGTTLKLRERDTRVPDVMAWTWRMDALDRRHAHLRRQ